MKKIIFLLTVVLLTFITISCNEDFSVKGPFDYEYVFNCILRGDSTTQYATITKSYDVADFNIYSNTVNPAVKGAKIRLTCKGKVYTMRDTVMPFIDPQYNTPVSCYYVKNMQLDISQTIIAQVIMPDGKILSAFTTTLPTYDLKFIGAYTIPEKDPNLGYLDHITLSWGLPANLNEAYSAKMYYAPQLEIDYIKKENGNSIQLKKIVPCEYKMIDNNLVPSYPEASNNGFCVYTLDAITRAMNEISQGDDNKSNYIILKAVFSVLMFDANLAVYYSANQTFDQGLTLNLFPPDFTNVNNGKGIFGSYIKVTTNLLFYTFYTDSFGYQYANVY